MQTSDDLVDRVHTAIVRWLDSDECVARCLQADARALEVAFNVRLLRVVASTLSAATAERARESDALVSEVALLHKRIRYLHEGFYAFLDGGVPVSTEHASSDQDLLSALAVVARDTFGCDDDVRYQRILAVLRGDS